MHTATALPWSVRRCIVTVQGRFVPPANRDAQIRRISRDVAGRLSRLPAALWLINIAWRTYAVEIDRLARVDITARTAAEERTENDRIASTLTKAAGLLQAEGQLDPTFYHALDMAMRMSAGGKYATVSFLPGMLGRDTARLSDFLATLAKWYEQGGPSVRVPGVPRPDRVGVNAAAALAFDRLSQFMESTAGRQHEELVKEIVLSYYPDATERDWGRARRVRKNSKKKSA